MEDLISANDFCTHYNIEFSFITTLNDYGLIEIMVVDDNRFIHTTDIEKLERIIRLHYDLDINIEGIEAITHLLNRLEHMQQELTMLKNRLGLYEQV